MPLPTVVVHVLRDKYDVYIGRPHVSIPEEKWGDWGNPFVIGKDGDRAEVVRKFREYAYRRCKEDPDYWERIHTELGGKRLGCWCAPEECHGLVYAEIADQGLEFRKGGRG